MLCAPGVQWVRDTWWDRVAQGGSTADCLAWCVAPKRPSVEARPPGGVSHCCEWLEPIYCPDAERRQNQNQERGTRQCGTVRRICANNCKGPQAPLIVLKIEDFPLRGGGGGQLMKKSVNEAQ